MSQSVKPTAVTPTPPQFAAFVGIDWADQHHAVCLSPANTLVPEQFTIRHTPEAIAELVATLRKRFGGRHVAIALEQARGALLYALMSSEFIVLYPVNPTTAKRYRDAFAPSGAKTDPVDARLLWELLVKHRDQLRPWLPDDPATRHLALLCEHRRDLVNQRTRCVQQLGAALKTYFPQALDWTGADLATTMALDFLLQWPTLAQLQQTKPQTVRAFYYSHRCRRPDLITDRLAQIKTATALTTDPAVIAAHACNVWPANSAPCSPVSRNTISRSPRCSSPIPTPPSLPASPALGRAWRRAWWPPSAPTATGFQTPPPSHN